MRKSAKIRVQSERRRVYMPRLSQGSPSRLTNQVIKNTLQLSLAFRDMDRFKLECSLREEECRVEILVKEMG
jgi:hypothetical protein